MNSCRGILNILSKISSNTTDIRGINSARSFSSWVLHEYPPDPSKQFRDIMAQIQILQRQTETLGKAIAIQQRYITDLERRVSLLENPDPALTIRALEIDPNLDHESCFHSQRK